MDDELIITTDHLPVPSETLNAVTSSQFMPSSVSNPPIDFPAIPTIPIVAMPIPSVPIAPVVAMPIPPSIEAVPVSSSLPIMPIDSDEEDSSLTTIINWVYQEDNKMMLIHTIADIFLFYMFFRFTQDQFQQTERMIMDTKEELNELKKQYGLE